MTTRRRLTQPIAPLSLRWNFFLPTIFIIALLFVTGASSATQAATLTIPEGGDFQRALNDAQPGDTIELAAGASYLGTFTLPVKSGSSFITIQSSALSSLPAAGTRVKPQDAANMPKIVSPGFGNPALKTDASAHHFRFIGIEFKPQDANAFAYDLIQFGDGTSAQNTLDKVPHDLALDRCYIHAYDAQELKRGVALNSAATDITNCYISSFKVRGQEAQAIMGYNGPGPYHIINNYLEAAGENILFGGATASINNLIPSDIEIRGNYMTKPLSWRGVYTVKNIFELKNAQRVKIDGNIFENCWVNAQVGYAILFTVRNEDGAMPWATISDVQFTNNIVRHASAAVNILGHDSNPAPSVTAHNIAIRNNLFEDINGATWDGDGAFLKICESIDVTVDHNTIFQTGNAIFAYGNANTNFAFTNNIIAHNSYGIIGDGHASGKDAINFYFPGSTVTGNALVAAGPPPNGPFLDPTGWYPTGNYYPLSFDAVGFANRAGGDYRLTSGTAYKNRGTDGQDVGCDLNALSAATTSVTSNPTTPASTPVPAPTVAPTPNPTPVPTPAPAPIVAPAPQTSVAVFSDDFNDNARDAAKWNFGLVSEVASNYDPAVLVVERNQRLEITPLVNTAGQHNNGYTSAAVLNMTNARAVVEVVKTTVGASAATTFAVGMDSDNWYRTLVFDGRLYFQDKVNGVKSSADLAYDASLHHFWRIRHDAASDAIVFETSGDGQAWTAQRTIARKMPITNLRVELDAGTYAAMSAPGTAIFDNFRFESNSALPTGSAPTILLASGSLNAGAILNAGNGKFGSVSITTQEALSADKRTRLMLFATGISAATTASVAGLSSANEVSANNVVLSNLADTVTVEARTSGGQVFQLPVEFAGAQNTGSTLDQVDVVLISELQGAGNVQLTLIKNGQRSNSAMVTIQ